MSTPLGERKASLSLKNSGGTLTGTQGVEGSSSEIFDGRTSGDDVAWKVSIKNPMPLTLAFSCLRRQHERRIGHRPDGELSVFGSKGVVLPVGKEADVSNWPRAAEIWRYSKPGTAAVAPTRSERQPVT